MSALVACADDDVAGEPVLLGETNVGGLGGTIAVAGFSLSVPPLAVDGRLDVAVWDDSAVADTAGITAISAVFRVEPTEHEFVVEDEDGVESEVPASVIIDVGEGVERAAVYRAESAVGPWEALDSEVIEGRVKAQTLTLGWFVAGS